MKVKRVNCEVLTITSLFSCIYMQLMEILTLVVLV